MSNDYYTVTGSPATGSSGSSAVIRAEFAAIQAAFDLLPDLTGNGGKLVRENAGGTALETVSLTSGAIIYGSSTGALAQGNNFAWNASNNTLAIDGNVTANGNISTSGRLSATGNAALNNISGTNLNITAASVFNVVNANNISAATGNFNGNVSAANLNVTGSSVLNALNANNLSAATGNFNGNISGTNLNITGALRGTSAMMSPLNGALGSIVTLNTTNFIDVACVAQGTNGTFFAVGVVTIQGGNSTATIGAKLWDGNNVIATTGVTTSSTGNSIMMSLQGFISNPTGNIRLSVRDNGPSNSNVVFNQTGAGKDTTVTAIRIG